MADLEFEIDADVDGAVAGLDKLEDKLEDTGDAAEDAGKKAKKSGDGWSDMAKDVANGSVAYDAIKTKILGVVENLIALGNEIERQAGIMNRFTGDIEKATERVGGMISNLDLMIQQSALAAAGIELTAEEFATLAVAATETASALGTDATGALEQFTQSLITGGGPAADLFKVKMDAVSSTTDKQIVLMGELTEQYGDVSSSADTLGGQFGVIEVQLANLQTEVIESVTQSAALDAEFDRLSDTLDRLGVGLPDITNDLVSFSDIVTGVLIGLTTQITNVATAMDRLASGDFSGALDALSEGPSTEESIIAAGRERRQREAIAAKERADREAQQEQGLRERLGGGRAAGGGAGAAAAEAIEEGLEVTKDAIEALNQEWLDSEELRLEATKDAAGERAAKEIQAIEDVLAAQIEAKRKESEVIKKLAQQEAQAQQAQMSLTNDVVGTTIAAGDQILAAVGATQGQMELWRGISDVAQAVTSFASQNYASGALFLISSALHFANAAQMGVGGGSGGQGQAASAAAQPQQPVSAPGPGGAPGGGGTVVVNFNAPTAEPLVGRDLLRTQRAAEQRFGRTG